MELEDMAFVSALLRHKLIRPSRLGRLIDSAEDAILRAALADAFALCRSRARGGGP